MKSKSWWTGVYGSKRERDCFDQRRSFFFMCIAKREESYYCCRCRDDVLWDEELIRVAPNNWAVVRSSCQTGVEELRREAVVVGWTPTLASPMEGGFCISYRLFSNISHPSSSASAPRSDRVTALQADEEANHQYPLKCPTHTFGNSVSLFLHLITGCQVTP